MGDTVGGAVGSVKETAGGAVGTVAQGATEAVDESAAARPIDAASPLAVGDIAVGPASWRGRILPETRRSRSLLGDASRQVADTVRQTVGDVVTKAEGNP